MPANKDKTSGAQTSKKESRHHHHHHQHEESRHKSSRHHHHHHHHHETTTETPTSPRRKSKTAHHHGRTTDARRPDAESGRHPSSSIGPGTIEPVLLLILIILAISSLALLCVGIWLLAVRDGWPSGLNNTGSVFWTRFISYGTACLILAVLFIPIIIIAAIAAISKSGSGARKLRLALIALVSLASLILLLMIVTSLLFATNGPSFINNVLEGSWKNTVKDDERFTDACDIQKKYSCEGWQDNSCLGCAPSVDGDYTTHKGTCHQMQKEICPRCWTYRNKVNAVDATQAAAAHIPSVKIETVKSESVESEVAKSGRQQKGKAGCRRFIERRNRELFIPMCVYTIFLLLVMVLLSWKACIDSSGRK